MSGTNVRGAQVGRCGERKVRSGRLLVSGVGVSGTQMSWGTTEWGTVEWDRVGHM